MSKFEDSIKKHKDGTLLDIFVTPKAKSVIFPAGYNPWRKRIEIKVSSEAKDNKANMDVIKTIAEYFSKPTKDVMIVSGQKNKEKTLFIKDILVDEAIKKLRKSF
ncbi:MAG: YggU family protein [Euryarchaeota archaeon RBG_13_31_8]|nr:MAG: YggU family protein [Euryarchaeota archaeon RBG_13_31_8]